uniref:Uncharacterized protein n=1 Tax=Glycine max TaxID=3847 RepID=C6T291_SOYBN|nr:unknown [Glycine max]ACU21504.1 unknown [Glycine max]
MALQAASIAASLTIMSCSSSFLAPTSFFTSLPSFKNRKVGIASTSHSLETVANSSTSTLRKVTFGNFLAISARIGAMKRHGPHQEAVKSTTINFLDSCPFLRCSSHSSTLWTPITCPSSAILLFSYFPFPSLDSNLFSL